MANDLGFSTASNSQYKDAWTVGRTQQIYDNISALTVLLSDYKQGVNINYNAVASVTVDTGSIMIAGKLRRNTTTATVGWANTGGNDIVETSSTGYYIWAVASGSTSTFEYAINQTSANMTGNANSRLIGWFWNDTANNIEGVWYKDKDQKKYYTSKWLANMTAATNYVFNHNLGTLRVMATIQIAGLTGSSITLIPNFELAFGRGTTTYGLTTATIGIFCYAKTDDIWNGSAWTLSNDARLLMSTIE